MSSKSNSYGKLVDHSDDGQGNGDNGLGFGNLAGHLPEMVFISLVDAIIAHPLPFLIAGENGATSATSSLHWAYDPHLGMVIDASAGFLATSGGNGNGGFTMLLGADGNWELHFSGSSKVIRGGPDHDAAPPPPPPSGNTVVNGASLPAGLANHDITFVGGTGVDTFAGGVGDYMIGGTGTAGGGLNGLGNCAVYSSSSASILADMQNGFGYGGNADGNVYVNMNQVRGSIGSNVLIGSPDGTDLKSGGSNSILISTGGSGFEMRPDGSGNILVSTVGADRVTFSTKGGWHLGQDNIMLGFSTAHGDVLDLSALAGGINFGINGGAIISDFHNATAVGYNAATGSGDISKYVSITDQADGSHLMFSADGHVQGAGTEILDMKFVHGLSVASLYQNHNLLL
jgi:hypothetical protein